MRERLAARVSRRVAGPEELHAVEGDELGVGRPPEPVLLHELPDEGDDTLRAVLVGFGQVALVAEHDDPLAHLLRPHDHPLAARRGLGHAVLVHHLHDELWSSTARKGISLWRNGSRIAREGRKELFSPSPGSVVLLKFSATHSSSGWAFNDDISVLKKTRILPVSHQEQKKHEVGADLQGPRAEETRGRSRFAGKHWRSRVCLHGLAGPRRAAQQQRPAHQQPAGQRVDVPDRVLRRDDDLRTTRDAAASFGNTRDEGRELG